MEQIDLYQGFDTFSGEAKNTAVVNVGTSKPTPEAHSHSAVTVATSFKQLQNSLEIDASVAVSYGVFSADAKSKYIHSLDVTTNSVTVVIYANKFETTSRTQVALSSEALKKTTSPESIQDFVREYGDQWVSKVSKGAELFITFTFYCQTKDEKSSLEVSLAGHGVVAGAKIDASLGTKISNAIKTSNVRYSINYEVDGIDKSIDLPKYKDDTNLYVVDLINYALTFSDKTIDKPITISYEVKPYEELFNHTVNFENVTTNRNLFLGNVVNKGWGEQSLQLLILMNTCQTILKTFSNYNYNEPAFIKIYNQIKVDLDYLITFISKVQSNPTIQYSFTKPDSLKYTTAKIRYTVQVPDDGKTFLSGGGGGPYSDFNTNDILNNKLLKSVRVTRDGGTITSLTTVYTSNACFTSNDATDNNNEIIVLPANIHGSPGIGQVVIDWTLVANEEINEIHGWMGDWVGHSTVNGLSFVSNLQTESSVIPFPTTNILKWKIAPNDIFVGFAGSCGRNLDGIQPITVTFLPTLLIETT
jgi:hypothetical protein